MRRAQQQVITFFAIDSALWPARKTGIVFATGDVKVSKDGGAFANTTNLPVELTLGVYSLTLTASETDCGWIHIAVRNTAMQPQDIPGAMSEQPSGAVVADAGNSATQFMTNLASAVTDFWKDALVVFTTGALSGQVKKVTGYNGTTKVLTFSAGFTAAPAATDKFLLVNA